MSNVPMGANEDSNAPWNEVSKKKLFSIKFYLERMDDMLLEVDENGDILDREYDKIKEWGKMLALSFNSELIDYQHE